MMEGEQASGGPDSGGKSLTIKGREGASDGPDSGGKSLTLKGREGAMGGVLP